MKAQAKAADRRRRLLEHDEIEIRGYLPRRVINVLDAMGIHQRVPRFTKLRLVLIAWADEKLQEATLITRLNQSNSERTSSPGKPSLPEATVKPIRALPLQSKP